MPAVIVAYDGRTGRVSKHFDDAYAARRFYAAKLAAGKNPEVKGANQ
jgi:hypothetical protein